MLASGYRPAESEHFLAVCQTERFQAGLQGDAVIEVPGPLQSGAKLILGEQYQLQQLLLIGLIVQQLSEEFQQARFQRLGLVDD